MPPVASKKAIHDVRQLKEQQRLQKIASINQQVESRFKVAASSDNLISLSSKTAVTFDHAVVGLARDEEAPFHFPLDPTPQVAKWEQSPRQRTQYEGLNQME